DDQDADPLDADGDDDGEQYHLFSVLIAMFSGFLGLMLAYYFDMAAGATIVVISSVLFFLTLLLKPYFSR
ncbi:metal ABC transporter permease, partial [Mitsuokella jalaludinii]|uniref:metal ABC transporter permease n=1 Tax=Mitsuokella jalaludinii TaxID=187979 RepID=UPI00307CF5BE